VVTLAYSNASQAAAVGGRAGANLYTCASALARPQVVPSDWLLAISVFLFMSLALVERCAELEETLADRQLGARTGLPAATCPRCGMGMSAVFCR
jgi:hypothetical protein